VLHLATITAPFYPQLAELGEFEEVQPADLPEDYQTLLAHDDHMTVTVEAFHGSMVDVRVLQEHHEGDIYSRASLLVRQTDGCVVQLGIMRINLHGLSPVVRAEVEARRTPLGRVLIRHNVLRHVQLHRLWRIWPGLVLQQHLGRGQGVEGVSDADAGNDRDALSSSETPPTIEKDCIYGRSAGIVVEGRPAVELLEIVRA
jgi:hypothetical protein